MDYWPSYIPDPSSLSESIDDPYIEATSETGDDAARVRYSKERQGPTKLTWKIMRLGDFVALKLFYAEHRAIEFLWLHPSRGLTYKTRFVSSPISSSEDGKAPFVAQVEVTLQIVALAPTEQDQPSASDLMETINAGADKAVQAAFAAGQARDEAGGYAQKAAASAKEAADTAAQIPAAVETGIEQIGAAGTSQVSAVKNAGSEQIAAVKSEGKAQTAAAKAQADAAAASAGEAAERLAEFKNLGATAKTLASGSNATASFDASTGVITIGVPIGKKGDKGDPGTFSDDGVTVVANASGEAMAKDVAIRGDIEDLASARGQIGPARELGNNVDFNTVTEAGLYLINAAGSVNAPRENQAFFLQVVRSVKGAITKNLFQIAYNYSSVADLVFIRQYRMASSSWSVWTQFITSSQVGDGLTVNNGIISVPEYEGATASTAGTSGLVPPATAGQQESFLTGGGEYKPALSTGGGTVTGNLSIKNLLDLIGTAPATEQELGLYHIDKNGNIMGGHDFVHNVNNIKAAQMYARNSSGLISSLGVYVEEDGTRYTLSSHNLVLTSDVEIGRMYADGVRLITFSGTKSSPGLMMRYSPDNGELYLDGRAVHGKADTAVYADNAGTLGGKAESALSVAFASEAQNAYGLKGMDMIIAKQTYTLPGYGTWKYMYMIADTSHFYDMVIGEDPGGTVLSASAWGSSAFMDGIAFRSA